MSALDASAVMRARLVLANDIANYVKRRAEELGVPADHCFAALAAASGTMIAASVLDAAFLALAYERFSDQVATSCVVGLGRRVATDPMAGPSGHA